MTDTPIEPALSREEWAKRGRWPFSTEAGQLEVTLSDWVYDEPGGDEYEVALSHTCTPQDLPALIALANAALPDDDPRKITREMVGDLDSCASWAEGEGQRDLADRVRRFAAALESYLPPE